jgi:parallel beta-helix repeat protein
MTKARLTSAVAALFFAVCASAATFTVTNTNDSGPGSLRQAILDATNAPGGDTVAFNIASPSKTIPIQSTLPDVASDTIVDGSTQPGFAGHPIVEIDGTQVPGTFYNAECLRTSGRVYNLVVNRCAGAGIVVNTGGVIIGNWVGLDLTGNNAQANGTGVRTGGSGLVQQNVISGNGYGVYDYGGTDIRSNWIGTNGTGSAVISNSTGIFDQYNSAGGEITGNYIVGAYWTPGSNYSAYYGLELFYVDNAVVFGNHIGVLPTGQAAPGLIVGIHVYQSNFSNITGNTVTGCANYGIHVDGNALRNHLWQNSVYDNTLGIRLGDPQYGPIAPTPNDVGDPDSGPNGRQNYPVLTSAKISGGNTAVIGTLNSNINQSYTIEFFSNTTCNPTGYGEGANYLSSTTVTTDGSGNASFSVNLPLLPSGAAVTTTATDSLNNTSEFSACASVQGAGAFRFSSSVGDVTEGGTVTLNVARVSGAVGAASVGYSTSNGTASAGSDFTSASGTLNFADGETSKSFTVPTLQDTNYEGPETFTATLSNATGGAVIGSPSTATVTISDDDAPPSLSINDASIIEGNSGTSNLVFSVTLSSASPATTTVSYYTSSNYASAYEDFQYTSGTLTFNPGEMLKTIAVPIFGDTKYESDETFVVYIYGSNNAGISKSYGIGTIVNDDAKPTITVSDARVVEGNSGLTNAVITLTASEPIYGEIDYSTADGTAKAGKDYQSVGFNYVYFFSEKTKTIVIPIIGDTEPEANETFQLKFGYNSTNTAIDHNPALVTIVNDDVGFGPKTQNIPLGTKAEFNLDLGIAPNAPFSLAFISSNPSVLDLPSSVNISGVATAVNAPSKAIGSTTVTVTLPSPYSQTFTSVVNVYEPATLVIKPSSIVVPEGGSVTASASFDPPASAASVVQLNATDATIFEVPASITIDPGKTTTFTIKALKKGSTTLLTTTGPEHGNQQSTIFVDVVEPPKTPLILSITPGNGPIAGGTSVTVNGANLSADCMLFFGGVPATNVALVSATGLTATAPPHPAGTVDVLLSCGSNSFNFANGFMYLSASPTVSTVTPSFGSTAGGTLVRITGSNFRSGCWPFFDTNASRTAVFVSTTEMIGDAPPHAAGTVTVAIRCSGGSDGSLADAFSYSTAAEPSAQINSVTPLAGAPGQSVTVTGIRFRHDDLVTFDAARATVLSSTPDTEVVRVPDIRPGVVAITSTDMTGHSTTTGPIFTVLESGPPHISTATPTTSRPGTDILLDGTGFRSGYTYAFGNTPSTLISLTYTRVMLRVPDIAPGTYALNVLNAAGNIASIGPSITVAATGPSISSITPACSSTNGGGTMTIHGSGFEAGASAAFDGILATTHVMDGNTLAVSIPAGAVGSSRIVITNPGGASASISGAFFYYSPFDPAGGCSGGRSRPMKH